MVRVIAKVSVGLALAGMAVTANAIPLDAVHFDVAGGSAKASGFVIGSQVSVKESAGLADVAFDLVEGKSFTFDFLHVSLSGFGLGAGIIDATLNFKSPEASADGLFAGFGVVLGFAAAGGLIPISLPDVVSFGNGGLFAVSFSGFGDSCLCSVLDGDVQATVTLLNAPKPTTSVPEPGTLSLLGAGLIAVGLSRRLKQQRAT